MAEKNFVELRQEDVFTFIDKELKKEKGKKSVVFSQKTKMNFMMVFVVDLIAIMIAVGGFYVVYNIFKAGEYKLVGTEGSIKGLEDVLYKEMQKKANLELEKKQKELDETKSKYEQLNSQLDKFKADQQKILKAQYDKLQADLNAKMNDELKNSTAQQREAIRKKYEDEYKAQQSALLLEAQKKEDELKKQMDLEKQNLSNLSLLKEKELLTTKSQLDVANADFQKKLSDQQAKNQQALDELNNQLLEQNKLGDFQNQINSLFKSAIDSYQKKQFVSVKDKFNSIQNLYTTQQKSFLSLSNQKSIDYFFIDTLKEYMDVKNTTAFQQMKQNEDKSETLKTLADFGNQLKRGDYKNKADADKKILQYSEKLPEIFPFYDNFNLYKRTLDDINSEGSISIADSYYGTKDYKRAMTNYVQVLKNYPEINTRNTVLDKIMSIYFGQYQVDLDVVNNNAEPVYNQGVALFKTKTYDPSIEKFQELLINYPNSKFVKDSIDYIQKCYDGKFSDYIMSVSNKSAMSLDINKKEQNKRAASIFDDALYDEKLKQFDSAIKKFEQIVLDCPISDYISKSVEGIDRVTSAKYRQGTYTVESVEYLKASIGKIVDSTGGEVVVYLDRSGDIRIGTVLYVYRKETEKDFRYVADITVSEISPVITKANVTKRIENIRIGDLVYKK